MAVIIRRSESGKVTLHTRDVTRVHDDGIFVRIVIDNYEVVLRQCDRIAIETAFAELDKNKSRQLAESIAALLQEN